MIRIESLSLQRGAKALFVQASVTLNPGEKIGLIGVNGAGKSTLFGLLRGVLHADGGELSVPQNWRTAHVMQDIPAVDRSALDYALDGDTRLRNIEQHIAAARSRHDGVAEAEAHSAFADADGYTAPARTEALLLGLGFTLEQTRHPVASFSGGWRMRLNLAQALMCPSDLLLLDEPTNHLDLDAIVWLETWLQRYAGTLITISHDREFLDAVCTVTLHIHDRKLQRYSGNYSQFEIQRAAQLALQQAAFEKQQKHIDHLQSYIDRFRYKASKSRQAQSRIKALEKMERIAPVHAASEFSFSFRAPRAAPDPMLVLEDATCGYHTTSGERTVLSDVNLSIQNGQRIGLLGANGQGKSTLVKTLAGVLAPLAGQVRSGKGLQIGYFAQHQLETLHPETSPLLHLQRIAPKAREQELRDFLGSFNFHGEMAMSPVGPFSGGEKARLALALIIWRQPNLLLLDEPTNNLDLETRHALTLALAEFEGTLILVSHDRFLLRATAEQFMLVAHGGLQTFDGDLDDYRDWLVNQATVKRTATQGNYRNDTSSANRKEKRRTEAQQRQLLAELRKPLLMELARLEQALETLTAEKTQLDAILADANTYVDSNKILLAESLKRHAQIVPELEDVETRWIEAQAQLEKSSTSDVIHDSPDAV
ncbi:MAG: ATP-binding cassette domain-containing protein [Gammaproteobacteria bacterium]|nr:ATP-binding cassette domain-containing protein [Gammaproteobacteria bacterium]